ncbi:MAG: two-component system chemotaxis response regulator CheY [bacterium]|jgi:two-component system chemotaxis response regulator CheY
MTIQKDIKLLIVEDNHNILKLLTNIFENIGFTNLVTADDGAVAWQLVQEGGIELVLTDWSMPKMNGMELLKKIRTSSDNIKNIPVLMITASDKKENILDAARLRVDGYIVKPFSVKTIISKINDIFS